MSADDLFEAALHKALGHPLRLRILESVIEQREASPLQLSRQLGQPLATVSRHMRLLRDLQFIELTRTEPRRGAVEHFYRAMQCAYIDDDTWERLPVPLRRGLVRQTFRKIVSEAAHAGGQGGFDRPGAQLHRIPLQLDPQARAELTTAITALLEHALAIQARADARHPNSPNGNHPHTPSQQHQASILVLMHFDETTTPTTPEAQPQQPAHLPPLQQ